MVSGVGSCELNLTVPKTLDLNVPFANIAKQLDGFIIAWQMKEAVVS